ncbi:hypothetical protein [Haloarcula marismortui]|uniref:Uncharacterized protein n=1 Tax=Haloarcula marismortui ATCC 33800 TaxID=662476 RepID=M0K4L0_9EURY|nr:hypothetical protein [Haloarcula sinaiiensis]EMA14785.1 hypothetical protein C436_06121 [Haloarcula sinaiiensis ATCC 33800]QUJ71808.1 hypothetical protein KDQ40_14115 [Haloarcula sinaiiensis ATCC 33800]
MVLVTNCTDCVKRVYPNRNHVPNTDRGDVASAAEPHTTPAETLTD